MPMMASNVVPVIPGRDIDDPSRPISVVIVRVIIVRIVVVRVPRIEAEIEDEPFTIDGAAMMAMPPMVTISIPIAVPIGAVMSENVILPAEAATLIST